MVCQQNLLERVYLTTKISGLTMVRPASSDFWKAPLVLGKSRLVLKSLKALCCWANNVGSCCVRLHVALLPGLRLSVEFMKKYRSFSSKETNKGRFFPS